ncbi:MAG: aminoacyl-tRNA hydrolase [Candidatus Peregrinibacteria bacterium]
MKIIVGLGNIGEKYAKTRHNCGFMFLDEFVRQVEKDTDTKIKWKEDSKLNAMTAKIPYKDQILLLVKPTTLMNNSGQAISHILNFFKESTANLIVIYDDIDLPLGNIRIREKGSAGTHNGMRSVIRELGTENFKRIRIGTESRGETTSPHLDISDFVLSDFTNEEISPLKSSIEEAIEALKNNLT